MDLEKLDAKVFFIPTPSQYEQEYLAKYLESQNIAFFAHQDDFNIKMLKIIKALYTQKMFMTINSLLRFSNNP